MHFACLLELPLAHIVCSVISKHHFVVDQIHSVAIPVSEYHTLNHMSRYTCITLLKIRTRFPLNASVTQFHNGLVYTLSWIQTAIHVIVSPVSHLVWFVIVTYESRLISRRPFMRCVLVLPHSAFLFWIHVRALFTFENVTEIYRILQGPDHSGTNITQTDWLKLIEMHDTRVTTGLNLC